MAAVLRIGTRDSQLAVWQATTVQNLLAERNIPAELVYIKSEGDLDTETPLYELGVQGVFTKALDAALLNKRIDLAVHSMKDVPTRLAKGIRQAAVLKRASQKDIMVFKRSSDFLNDNHSAATIATSSIRRIAQWKNRYPNHQIENLRGNVNTRLRKLEENNWNGAIFAAAGLERIDLRPENSIDLDWMLPAPAQGAVVVVCREEDENIYNDLHKLNDPITELCTGIERDFLRTLMGGCSTPISGYARMENAFIIFNGSICATDGSERADIEQNIPISEATGLGIAAAHEILQQPAAKKIMDSIRNAKP